MSHTPPPRRSLGDALVAGTVAAALSGAPSTVHAVWRRQDPLAASLAAGTILLPSEAPPRRLLGAAALVHGGLSLGWAVALTVALPRQHTALWGAVAGLGIAALDLGVLGRRFPRVAALPPLPQVADHVAYGVVVGLVLARRAP